MQGKKNHFLYLLENVSAASRRMCLLWGVQEGGVLGTLPQVSGAKGKLLPRNQAPRQLLLFAKPTQPGEARWTGLVGGEKSNSETPCGDWPAVYPFRHLQFLSTEGQDIPQYVLRKQGLTMWGELTLEQILHSRQKVQCFLVARVCRPLREASI